MVIRYYVKCTTCGTSYTTRISVGSNIRQEHSFQCVECKEDLKVEMEVDFENLKTKLNCIEGCEKGEDEGIIINLNPNITVSEEFLHQDGVFPWLMDLHKIVEKHPDMIEKGTVKINSYEELKKLYKKILRTLDGWAIIKKGWSLTLNKKNELAQKVLKSYQDIGFESNHNLHEILYHFFGKMIYPNGFRLFTSAGDTLKIIATEKRSEFLKFQNHYKESLYDNHLRNYYNIFCEYFDEFSEYSQTLIFMKYGMELPENHHASSKAFNKTRMFYGNAFEVLTSHFTIFACLNNILSNRRFDEFENMTLSKYLKTNKANRANPFKSTESFFNFAKDIESKLRNASHHNAINLENDYVIYKSGGTGALNKITYAEYIYKCNRIAFNLMALLIFELVLAS